ncbi:MAG: hypothetical protein GVY18_10445 [Bacteroidetes bacterium]|jgi:hypothetical protein|nr:hypothetical protein [Bacteroidota bacterium]
MAGYEVFDNDEVHLRTRQQAAHLTDTAAFAVGLTLGVMALGGMQLISLLAAGGLIVAIWAGATTWIVVRRRQLQRVAWCVKLSDRQVVSYDYRRKPTTLDWDAVAHVDLDEDGLVLIGPEGPLVSIPALFPEFASLSHAIVRQAEAHDVTIMIDGCPWQQLNIYSLFPFLADDSSAGTAGAAA